MTDQTHDTLTDNLLIGDGYNGPIDLTLQVAQINDHGEEGRRWRVWCSPHEIKTVSSHLMYLSLKIRQRQEGGQDDRKNDMRLFIKWFQAGRADRATTADRLSEGGAQRICRLLDRADGPEDKGTGG